MYRQTGAHCACFAFSSYFCYNILRAGRGRRTGKIQAEKEEDKDAYDRRSPDRDVRTYFGKYDCTEEQLEFLKGFVETRIYDDYDRLIQLCDAISLPAGACTMEKKPVDVAMRHGLPEFTLNKWRAFMEIKKYFDELCGCNVYSLLPCVMENSYVSLL